MTEEQEREAFEAWRRRTAKTANPDTAVALNGFGDDARYDVPATRAMWTAWQARASLPSNPEHDTYGAPPVGALTDEQILAIVSAAPALDSVEAEWLYVVRAALALSSRAPMAAEELSPEFTDTARSALLWVLWHQQGVSSGVSEAIRFALGMGADEPMSDYQIREAKRYGPLMNAFLAEAKKAGVTHLAMQEGVSGDWCAAFPKAAANIINSLARKIDALEAAPSHPPATPANIDWKAEYDGAQEVLTEIRTALNASGYWPLGMDLFASIRGLLAATPAVAVQAEPKAVADELIEANPYPTYTFVAQNAAVEQERAERYARTLLRTALAAHPEPAAPLPLELSAEDIRAIRNSVEGPKGYTEGVIRKAFEWGVETARSQHPKPAAQSEGERPCALCGSKARIPPTCDACHDSMGTKPKPAAPAEHIASPDCWCEPEVDYVDPDTGATVYVHKGKQ